MKKPFAPDKGLRDSDCGSWRGAVRSMALLNKNASPAEFMFCQMNIA